MEQQLLQANEAIERGRHDIVFFAWYFLGITMHKGQIRFVRSADGQINVLVPANRWGKTVTIAIRHIWHCFYKKGYEASSGEAWSKVSYRTAALAPDSKILSLDYQVIMDVMRGRFVISPKGEPVKTNECRISWYLLQDQCRTTPSPFIQFRDNTAIKFYSTANDKGTSVQGAFFGYGSYDEGGRSYWLDLEINQNLGPRFGELKAPLDLVSTPAMDSPSLAYHYDIFQKGLRDEDGFKSFEGSAYENIYLPKWYFEREEKRLKGNPLRDQVLEGKFVFSGATIFPIDDINTAKDDDLNPGVPFQAGHKYIAAVDTAMGEDEQVHTVIDYTDLENMRVVRQVSCQGNSKSPDFHVADFEGLVRSYCAPTPNGVKTTANVKIIVEAFNGESGMFCLSLPYDLQAITTPYGTWNFPGRPKTINGKNPRNVKKADIILSLRKALANGRLKLPNEPTLIKQLSVYREDDTKLKTDRVISLALAVWLATDGAPKANNQTIEVNW